MTNRDAANALVFALRQVEGTGGGYSVLERESHKEILRMLRDEAVAGFLITPKEN